MQLSASLMVGGRCVRCYGAIWWGWSGRSELVISEDVKTTPRQRHRSVFRKAVPDTATTTSSKHMSRLVEAEEVLIMERASLSCLHDINESVHRPRT